MQAQTPAPMPRPMQNDAVMALGARARRLAWGYFVYVVYYLGIMVLFAYHGVRVSSVGQFATDLMRLSGLLVPLTAYIAVNAAIGLGLNCFVRMRAALRWCIAAGALLLALVTTSLLVSSVWRWLDLGRPDGVGLSHLIEFVLTAGYLILAALVVNVTRLLGRYVRIDDSWLPKVPA